MKRTPNAPLLFVSANLAAIALVAATALLAAPAFARGYDLQPSYAPTVGAPASQRVPSAQTLAAKARIATIDADADGGTYDTHSESGGPAQTDNQHLIYMHR